MVDAWTASDETLRARGAALLLADARRPALMTSSHLRELVDVPHQALFEWQRDESSSSSSASSASSASSSSSSSPSSESRAASDSLYGPLLREARFGHTVLRSRSAAALANGGGSGSGNARGGGSGGGAGGGRGFGRGARGFGRDNNTRDHALYYAPGERVASSTLRELGKTWRSDALAFCWRWRSGASVADSSNSSGSSGGGGGSSSGSSSSSSSSSQLVCDAFTFASDADLMEVRAAVLACE